MQLDWLESYLAFAETRNFTHAAARLYLSQPALHVQVRRLAEDLGVELYRREGRELTLTEAGVQAEAFARELLDRVASFRRELRSDVDTTPPVVVAGQGTHTYLLAEPLRRWVRKRRPLSLRTGDLESSIEDIRTGRAHLAVAPVTGHPKGLATYRFRRVGQKAVVASNHALAGRAKIGLTALGKHPLILPPADRPHRIEIARRLRAELGHDPEVSVETGGWELMMLYASLGLGVAVVNDFCTTPKGTTSLAITGLGSLEYRLIERKDAQLPPLAEELKRHLLGS